MKTYWLHHLIFLLISACMEGQIPEDVLAQSFKAYTGWCERNGIDESSRVTQKRFYEIRRERDIKSSVKRGRPGVLDRAEEDTVLSGKVLRQAVASGSMAEGTASTYKALWSSKSNDKTRLCVLFPPPKLFTPTGTPRSH